MLVVFTYGTVASYGTKWAQGNPVLIPVHGFEDSRAHAGPFLAILSIIWGIQYLMFAVGKATEDVAFPGGFNNAGDWIVFAAFVALFLLTLGLTLARVTSPFSWMYRGEGPQPRIVWYIFSLIMFLAPQALWDFLVLPPFNWAQWTAGILTLGVELVAWIVFYLVSRFWLNLHVTDFAPEKSLVRLWEFSVLTGGLQILSGIAYVITAEFVSGTTALNILTLSIMGGILVVNLVIYVIWTHSRRRLLAYGGSRDAWKTETPKQAMTAEVFTSARAFAQQRLRRRAHVRFVNT